MRRNLYQKTLLKVVLAIFTLTDSEYKRGPLKPCGFHRNLVFCILCLEIRSSPGMTLFDVIHISVPYLMIYKRIGLLTET